MSESVEIHGIAEDVCSSWEFCSRLLVVFLLREAKYSRVVNICKPHGIFSVHRLLEQDWCRDMLRRYRSRDLAGDRSATLKATVLKMDEKALEDLTC